MQFRIAINPVNKIKSQATFFHTEYPVSLFNIATLQK